MPEHIANSIYIHDCGFVSALGSEHGKIHQCLSGEAKPAMELDAEILNDSSVTVVGRVKETLPNIPEVLKQFDTRNNQLALAALKQIENTVKKAIQEYGGERIAVIIGTSTSGIADGEDAYQKKLLQGSFSEDYHYSKQELGNCSDFIARYLGITGPSYTISTACSSSGRAFITAKRLLQAKWVDAVVVGGVDSICKLTLNGFYGLDALAQQRCRPFDQHRSGINIGEAASLMLLGRAPSDVALLGVGDSSDAYHISAPEPNGNGAEQAIRNALNDAKMLPEDIGYINAHGTATPLNDRMESSAIYRIFGQQVPVSSTKHLTGHTLGAASATEAAIAWHILKYNLTLPQQGCLNKDDDMNILLLESPIRLNNKAILSNSFAFGGNNVSLIFACADE